MAQRRIFLAIAAAAALGGCASPPVAAAGRLVDMRIVDRSRHVVLSEYHHRGETWVAGRPGDRYAVRLTNRTGARVLVVLSVDGINAVSGETAGVAQTGYVLAPWQSAEITGWRKSDAEAAAFYFTALPDSYAARTDRPHNVGVIGAAVFRERSSPPLPPRYAPTPFGGARGDGAPRAEPQRRAEASGTAENAADASGAPPAPAAAAEPAVRERDAAPLSSKRADKLGTGHGEREYAPIERTSFERATSYPSEIVQLRYDSEPNLIASGVISRRFGGPDPFPGYVPDPRW